MSHEQIKGELVRCEIQGRIFREAQKLGYDMDIFVDAFMRSHTCYILDDEHITIWGRSVFYLIEEVHDEVGLTNPHLEPRYNEDMLDWIGWAYRWWQLKFDTPSKRISEIVPFKDMKTCWPFHVMSFDLAIDRIREAYEFKLYTDPPGGVKVWI